MRHRRTNPQSRPQWYTVATNQSDEDCPSQGCLESIGRDASTRRLLCRKSVTPIKSQVVMAPFGIPAGGVGLVVQQGQHPMTVTLAAGETIAAGDRAALSVGAWYLTPCDLGPVLVIDVMDDIPAGGGEVEILAEITGLRGDHVFVRTKNEEVRDSAQVIYLKQPLACREASPGVVEIYKT